MALVFGTYRLSPVVPARVSQYRSAGRTDRRTVWSLLEERVGERVEPFRRSEIIGWFCRHHPEVNEATLAAIFRRRR